MDLKTLDYIFPFVAFGYGLLMLLVLENPWLTKRLEKNQNLSKVWRQSWENLQQKKIFAYIMFVIGGLWSLQNLWFGTPNF